MTTIPKHTTYMCICTCVSKIENKEWPTIPDRHHKGHVAEIGAELLARPIFVTPSPLSSITIVGETSSVHAYSGSEPSIAGLISGDLHTACTYNEVTIV